MDADRIDLHGTEILILEDEYYLADELRLLIERAHGRVAGPYPDAAGALGHLAVSSPACAILDVNLDGAISFEVADALVARTIPFLFLTGYDSGALPERFGRVERIEKPADLDAVLRKLGILAGPRGHQAATVR